jgi:hypothetical protein
MLTQRSASANGGLTNIHRSPNPRAPKKELGAVLLIGSKRRWMGSAETLLAKRGTGRLAVALDNFEPVTYGA